LVILICLHSLGLRRCEDKLVNESILNLKSVTVAIELDIMGSGRYQQCEVQSLKQIINCQ